MSTIPPEVLAQWHTEADEKIKAIPPQGVGGTGDARVVMTNAAGDFEFEVARFSTWGSLVTSKDAIAAAERYAETLRQSYIDLATGWRS